MSKAKNKTQKTLTFLYGLPASGKTTWAQVHGSLTYSYSRHRDNIVNVDALIVGKKLTPNQIIVKITDEIKSVLNYHENVIVDGLFTTNEQLRKIFDYLNIELDKYELHYKLVWWKEDRETCLYNDRARREKNSTTSIKNLPFEKPDLTLFPELKDKNVMALKVVKTDKPVKLFEAMKTIIGEFHIKDDQILISESWSGGGEYGNCWNDTMHSVSPDDPLEFVELDKLLIHIAPAITFLQYREVTRRCCKIVSDYKSDYYGGGTTNFTHNCDLKELEKVLIEFGYIKNEEEN